MAIDPQVASRDSMDALPLVHDLVRLRTSHIAAGCISEPSWVKASVERSPWVVVRRALAPEGLIAVGVRGKQRHERWGGFVRREQITERAAPCDLRTPTISSGRVSLPAMQALRYLEKQFSQLALEWGPGGSIGYEIATGHLTATQNSDLDLIIRAPGRLEPGFATDLLATIKAAPVQVDPRIETLSCGFSLQEYCSNAGLTILVRTPVGYEFSDDPWTPRQGNAGISA
jgi:phosphoribosyl-dephospho-CoA transferase